MQRSSSIPFWIVSRDAQARGLDDAPEANESNSVAVLLTTISRLRINQIDPKPWSENITQTCVLMFELEDHVREAGAARWLRHQTHAIHWLFQV
jgi:hypothetical protein